MLFNILRFFSATHALNCKDESGADISAWTIMKLPQGTEYYYYDTNTGYNFSPYSLNDTVQGALAQTVGQLWIPSTTGYMIYNDEPPNQAQYNFSVAHAKAIWMWDNTSALVITHSIPKFPEGPGGASSYTGLEQNAWEYGQAASCFSVPLSSLGAMMNIVNEMGPLIYDTGGEEKLKNKHLLSKTKVTSPCSIYNYGGGIMIMKDADAEVDIWASCVGTYFSGDVRVESWIHGETEGPYCTPDYAFDTLDIQKLKYPGGQEVVEYDDHSKWGLLESTVVCFGDLNRVVTQKTRAGAVYCWKDVSLWGTLDGMVESTNTCYRRRLRGV